MGFGQAAYDTTSMALLLSMFPSRTATTWSFVELTVALGYISGAPFGGFLNEIEGFYFPFVISGSILLVFTPLLVYLMSDSQLLSENMYTEDEGEVTSWKLLKMPPIVLVCANLSSCFISMQLFETSMAVFLDKEFGWSSSYIGLVFLVSGAVYFVMTIFTGPLVDATNPRVLMIIGLLMEGCAMMAVGPSFVFSFLSPKPWCVYLSMVLFGLGMPLITISAGPDMIRTATLRGYEKNMSLNGAVSGLVLAATFLSGTVGAPIAGGLTAAFDFRHSSSYFAFFNFLLVIISIVATASEAFMSRRIMHN
ncbi:MFS-type transporter SLC18B1-like [Corticium candelabrum]|uniref:MFS-type transporter SLC18B1-like n=1 Tax=Corticium candelabrum TaxID=121492 RepID=UPI002E265B7A|nr:MFS-type transporter SLC18B1-like [Corticium candelabrum]